jgi:hypothetical protein
MMWLVKLEGQGYCLVTAAPINIFLSLISCHIANHEKEEWINGEKTEDVVAFLDRLYTAKRKVEERIVTLGGEDSVSPDLFSFRNPSGHLCRRLQHTKIRVLSV